MKQSQETPVGVSSSRLTLAYKELFPGEFDLKNLPEIEQTMQNWLDRYYSEPDKAIATQNWAGKVTQALFHALGIEQPKTKEDAIAQAGEAFDTATIWDDNPDMPLLYDDFEEIDGRGMAFNVIGSVPEMKDLPEPDPSALQQHKDEAARTACSMLITAFQKAKQSGKKSVSLTDLEAACEAAIEAESGYREPIKVLVEVEGGSCFFAYSTRPIEVVVMDADKARSGGEGDVVSRIAFPEGIEAKTVLCDTKLTVAPDFVREVFAMRDANEMKDAT